MHRVSEADAVQADIAVRRGQERKHFLPCIGEAGEFVQKKNRFTAAAGIQIGEQRGFPVGTRNTAELIVRRPLSITFRGHHSDTHPPF